MGEELSIEIQKRIVYKALLSRRVEESLLDLFAQGKLFGTVHTCIGQEFVGATLTEHLADGDSMFSNHRCHGHFLSRTKNVKGLIAEIMGKATGVCGGLGGSQHLCDGDFYSNGIQGGIAPVAAGLALARKLKKSKNISVVFIGDGTLGEGALYETLNLAAKWALPLLIVLENNLYAQSTSQLQTLAGSITGRAESFGIKTQKANTWEWQDLYAAARDAVHSVRTNCAPVFLQVDTFRLKAHSKGDDNRPRSEVEPFEKKDPLNLLIQNANSLSLDLKTWDSEIAALISKAISEADADPILVSEHWPAFQDKADFIEWMPAPALAEGRYVESLNKTFRRHLMSDDKIQMLGEDIESPYGGAFKVMAGLSSEFGERVRNTPISEAAITGIGIGLAIEGFRPLVEIMFGDFTGLTFDQLVNHAAKFHFMYNRKVETNFVLRTPMGGHRGYGPTHSQTLDRHFLGVPGLRVLALNSLLEPSALYDRLLTTSSGPTLVIENKILYTQFLKNELAQGFTRKVSQEDYPSVLIEPAADQIDVTLIGYGGMADFLTKVQEQLFDEHDLVVQLLVPAQIYPLNAVKFQKLVERAPFLVFVEEGQNFANFSSEFISQLAESVNGLKQKVLRIGPKATGIPSSGYLEKEALPNVGSIVAQIAEFIEDVI